MNAEQKQVLSVEAVVIRADGTREDLGVIATSTRNPLVRLIRRVLRSPNVTERKDVS